MSIEGDSTLNDLNVKELLEVIAEQLIIMNARIEAGFETGIEDIKDVNN